ncbi:MAG: hypothetical protein KDA52_05205 [Planctomycetaceae bacterium]|nr:hypothetical protein [Planctomycetaceae bacterium]
MVNPSSQLTVGDVARIFGVETWQVRRVVDRLDVEIPRFGRYRLIPRVLLGTIAAGLRDSNWLPRQEDNDED